MRPDYFSNVMLSQFPPLRLRTIISTQPVPSHPTPLSSLNSTLLMEIYEGLQLSLNQNLEVTGFFLWTGKTYNWPEEVLIFDKDLNSGVFFVIVARYIQFQEPRSESAQNLKSSSYNSLSPLSLYSSPSLDRCSRNQNPPKISNRSG